MKKVLGTVLAVALSVGLTSGAVLAQSITNTGPGSTNVITVDNNTNCTVDNSNNVNVDNSNTQGSGSGNSSNSGNTNGGNSTTGGSTNQNGSSTNVNINNGGCTPVTTAQTTPEPTPTGGASTPEAQVLDATTPLPETGNPATTMLIVSSIVLASGIVLIVSSSVRGLASRL